MAGSGLTSQHIIRQLATVAIVIGLHGLLLWSFEHSRPVQPETTLQTFPVILVAPPDKPKPVMPPVKLPSEPIPPNTVKPADTRPAPPPDRVEDLPTNKRALVPELPTQPIIQPPQAASSRPIEAAPLPEGASLIPDRWRLPAGARTPLENTSLPQGSFGQTLDCLKGFKTECAEIRKSVFAEDQLSDTDLVWMPSYAHSGLSDSDLYGMSEAQIRERLGIPTAGKNGFMIFPGIGIDGPWWDALHGVNKACDYGIGVNDEGERQLMKRCKALKPAAAQR